MVAGKGAATYGWQREERDPKQRATRGHDLARPGDGHCVAVADGAEGYLVRRTVVEGRRRLAAGQLGVSVLLSWVVGGATHHAPPKGIGKVVVLLVGVLLGQVHQER
jgi:hypothetical protein